MPFGKLILKMRCRKMQYIDLPHSFTFIHIFTQIVLANIHSAVIQIQVDLNPFLRSSIDFNTFLCTHYLLVIGQSPDH